MWGEVDDQTQVLTLLERGVAEQRAHVEHAETAHFHEVAQFVRADAGDGVGFGASKFRRVVDDESMAAGQQIQGQFAFANAWLAGDQHAGAHDIQKDAVQVGGVGLLPRQGVIQGAQRRLGGHGRCEADLLLSLAAVEQRRRCVGVAGDQDYGAQAAGVLLQPCGRRAIRLGDDVVQVALRQHGDRKAPDGVELPDWRGWVRRRR